MKVFVIAAGIMVVIHLIGAWRRPRLALFVSAILWLAYAIWEWSIVTGLTCDPDCNIRVDLVLVIPILLISTIYAHSAYNRPDGERTIVGMGLGAAGLVVLALLVLAFGYVIPATIIGLAAVALAGYAIKSKFAPKRDTH